MESANSRIIRRLSSCLDDYLSQKIGVYNFTEYLKNSVEALEGISYDAIQIGRDFENKFEVASFSDVDPSIESVEKVTSDFRDWLESLRGKYPRTETL